METDNNVDISGTKRDDVTENINDEVQENGSTESNKINSKPALQNKSAEEENKKVRNEAIGKKTQKAIPDTIQCAPRHLNPPPIEVKRRLSKQIQNQNIDKNFTEKSQRQDMGKDNGHAWPASPWLTTLPQVSRMASSNHFRMCRE